MAPKTHNLTEDDIRSGLTLETGVVHRVVIPIVQKLTLVSVTPQFAPGPQVFTGGDLSQPAAGDQCVVTYRVVDSPRRLKEARLEILRKAQPGTPIAKIPLEGEALAPGEHSFAWDGQCTEGAMAGKYVHALWSPYVVRIVGKGVKGELKDEGKETSVVLAELLMVRGADVPAANPPAPASDASYQQRLLFLGYHPGPIDGVIGPKTRLALKNFQRAHGGLKEAGALDAHTKAALDQKAPPGTGTDHYQGILNALGYRCGVNDGLVGRRTKLAIANYRDDKGLPPGTALDDAVKQALDAEALPPLLRREILEGDLAVGEPFLNSFPQPGTEKKVFVASDGSFSPRSLPQHKKFGEDRDNLSRPHFAVIARPIIKRTDGSLVFAPAAVGPLRIDFTLDTTVLPPADLGIPSATPRAFVQTLTSKDGGEATTGHHAHHNRGGVRTGAEPRTFLDGKRYAPFDVKRDGNKHRCLCVETKDDPTQGTAGVYFVPSIVAGDRFGLVATVNAERFDTPPPAPIATKSGTMIVWRRYRIAKLWFMEYVPRPHRTETMPHLGLPAWYDPAFIEWVEPRANPHPIMVKPRAPDDRVINLDLFTSIVRQARYLPAHVSDAAIKSRFDNNILWPLMPAAVYNAGDEQGYYDAISGEIDQFEERFANTLRDLSDLEDGEGLVVLVFDRNAPRAGNGGIHAVGNPQLQHWGWSVLASKRVVHLIFNQDVTPHAVAAGATDGETLAHEAGHALWLHHASTVAGSPPDVADRPEHNPPEWQSCTMSYVTLHDFCGRCVLKLRGFDEAKL